MAHAAWLAPAAEIAGRVSALEPTHSRTPVAFPALSLSQVVYDASALVRCELAAALSRLVRGHMPLLDDAITQLRVRPGAGDDLIVAGLCRPVLPFAAPTCIPWNPSPHPAPQPPPGTLAAPGTLAPTWHPSPHLCHFRCTPERPALLLPNPAPFARRA
jgi:hypothetical protein